MRTVEITLTADESVQMEQPVLYMGEHQAARLAIVLPPRLQADFDYYALCFDLMDRGAQTCTGNIYPGQAPGANDPASADAWLEGGTLYCTLPGSVTCGSWLRCQVAAYCQNEGGCTKIERSAPFVLNLTGAVQGDCSQLTPFTAAEAERVLAQLDAAKNNLAVDWNALEFSLRQLLTEGMAAAQDGCRLGTLTAETNGQLIAVHPGKLWSLQFSPGVSQAHLVLDDSSAAADYAPEFRLRVLPPDVGAAELNITCLDGQAVRMPDWFAFRAGRCYELNILDRHALATSWEVAA
ncbi:MAG: hypothetical protein LBC83_07720 [Oscillospiraceae bacterium]|jgi:hypothetical protein|nr:hypothetical protein [Oscillospiraceae bacterium]